MKKAIMITGGIGSVMYFIASLLIGYELYNSIFGFMPSENAIKIYASVEGILMIALPVCYGMELIWNRKMPLPPNGTAMFFFAWTLVQYILFRLVPANFYGVARVIMLQTSMFKDIAFFETLYPSTILLSTGMAFILASCLLTALGNRRASRQSKKEEV